MNTIASSFFALAAILGTAAFAADNRPHQHGSGELNVVVDGHDLLLEVRLPAIDIVGFEHTPETAAQQSKVTQALARFKTATAWFEPSSSARCELKSALASVVGLSTPENPGEAKTEHPHEHQHSDAHSPGSKKGAIESNDNHADFEGTTQFHCDSPDKLKAVSVLFFKSYPGVTSLRVQMITPGSQTSHELTPDESVLPINP